MTTYRRNDRDRWTTVDNATVRDPDLSFKATGLLVYLLSHASDFQLTREQLAERKADGVASVRSGLTELYRAHYLRKRRVQGDDGKWRTIVDVFEVPTDNPDHPQHCTATEGGKSAPGTPHRRLENRPSVFQPVKERTLRKTSDTSFPARSRVSRVTANGEVEKMDVDRAGADLLGDAPLSAQAARERALAARNLLRK